MSTKSIFFVKLVIYPMAKLKNNSNYVKIRLVIITNDIKEFIGKHIFTN